MSKHSESWDLVITPQHSLFKLDIKTLWHYRDLLMLFVRRDFVSFYKQTALGPVWFFIQPLFTMGVYVFIFGRLAGISTDGLPQPLFYLAGITAWSYFSECLLKTATVFRDNANMFGKVYFPRLIVPFSIVISNLVKFGVQLLLLILLMIYFKVAGASIDFSFRLLIFPLLVILMAAQGLGLGLIVSSLTTKYRDLALLLTFGIQLLMFSTTVVYPLSSVSGNMRTVVALNPMTPVLEGIRFSLFGTGTFDLGSFMYATIAAALLIVTGVLTFNKVEKNFVDTI